MKAVNFFRGTILAIIAVLVLTVIPVQNSIYAKDHSSTVSKEMNHKTGKHKHKKKHKKSTKKTTDKSKDNSKDKSNGNGTQNTPKTNKK